MAKQESPRSEGNNVIDFTQHRRRKGEARNTLPSFREQFYKQPLQGGKKPKPVAASSLKTRLLVGLQLAIVLFGMVVIFRSCIH